MQLFNDDMNLKKLSVILATVSLFAIGFRTHTLKNLLKKPSQSELQVKINNASLGLVKNPVQRTKYHTDTLDYNTSVIMFFSNGSITRNYVRDKKSAPMNLSSFEHEKWHEHNNKIEWRVRFSLTPEEFFKACLHDEISACITALLTLRYQYLASDNKAEFIKQYKNGAFKYYFNALEKGKINPEDQTFFARDKEWRFIANETPKMWMERCYKAYYSRTYRMMMRYIARKGLKQSSNEDYEKICRYMYTIGGINFWEYVKDDVSVKSDNVKIAEQMGKIPTLNKGGKFIINDINKKLALLSDVSLTKQKYALQHLLISAKLRYALRQFSVQDIQNNPSMIDSYYSKLLENMRQDEMLQKFVHNFSVITSKGGNLAANDSVYDDVLRKFYTIKGIDLRKIMQNFDAHNLPYQSQLYSQYSFIRDLGWRDNEILSFEMPEKDEKQARDKVIEEQTNSVVSRSIDMYIDIPNFWEPILIDHSDKVQHDIMKCVNSFNELPEVKESRGQLFNLVEIPRNR